MKKFVVERNLPGAANLTAEELQALSQDLCEAISRLDNSYHWIESFITADKIYCIHIAESEEAIWAHAGLGILPINTVSEVKAVINPETSNNA